MKYLFEIIIILTILIVLLFSSCSPKIAKMSQSDLSKYPIDTSGVAYSFFDTDIKIIILKKEVPHYPEEAKKDGAEGIVIVETTISPEGKVIAVRVEKSVHPALDEEAMRTAEKCQFQPAIKNGKRVVSKLMLPFHFKLNK